MNEWSALEVLTELAADDEPVGVTITGDGLRVVLAAMARLEVTGELVDGEAEAIKTVLMFLQARLERIERDVIRHLKYESDTARTWEEVAAEFGDLYGGRAAVFNRFKRLCDGDRRSTSMDMRRGAAVPGRRTATADVVDTTTE